MRKINTLSMIALTMMAVISFSNLLGVSAAGISVILGVAFFFVNKSIEKQPFAGSGLDIKAIGKNLKERSIWFWVIMPLIMDAVSIGLGKLFIPGYIEHVIARAGLFVSFDVIVITVIQLIVFALGEEIAWRAFFQKQCQKVLPVPLVLITSSLLFSLGHIQSGSFSIVAFDVFFVFVNSVLYGIVFQKTNNAWVSTISHFAANLFSVVLLVFL